jgi:hypothetical protein
VQPGKENKVAERPRKGEEQPEHLADFRSHVCDCLQRGYCVRLARD